MTQPAIAKWLYFSQSAMKPAPRVCQDAGPHAALDLQRDALRGPLEVEAPHLVDVGRALAHRLRQAGAANLLQQRQFQRLGLRLEGPKRGDEGPSPMPRTPRVVAGTGALASCLTRRRTPRSTVEPTYTARRVPPSNQGLALIGCKNLQLARELHRRIVANRNWVCLRQKFLQTVLVDPRVGALDMKFVAALAAAAGLLCAAPAWAGLISITVKGSVISAQDSVTGDPLAPGANGTAVVAKYFFDDEASVTSYPVVSGMKRFGTDNGCIERFSGACIGADFGLGAAWMTSATLQTAFGTFDYLPNLGYDATNVIKTNTGTFQAVGSTGRLEFVDIPGFGLFEAVQESASAALLLGNLTDADFTGGPLSFDATNFASGSRGTFQALRAECTYLDGSGICLSVRGYSVSFNIQSVEIAAVPEVVPTPATLSLLALGLLAAVRVSQRRQA